MKPCSVTCTGTTGNSMTSRVRRTQPPDRCVPQSGQLTTTCSTRWVGVMRTAGEAVASMLAGLLLRWRLAARTGPEGRAFGAGSPVSA